MLTLIFWALVAVILLRFAFSSWAKGHNWTAVFALAISLAAMKLSGAAELMMVT